VARGRATFAPLDRPERVNATLRPTVHVPAVPAPPSAGRAPHPAARLGLALAAYVAAFVGVITLYPFRFSALDIARRFDPLLLTTPFDLVANVALFVPLGFLLRLGWRDARWWVVPLVGTAASLCIETAQLFEAARYSALADVATNGAGAGVGALLHDLARRRLRGTERLTLELPLMGLVYLTLPLAWLDASLVATRSTGALPLLFLGLFGASVLASVQAGHLAPWGIARRGETAVAAGVWFVVATVPAWPAAPVELTSYTVLVMAYVWLRGGASEPAGAERRFEGRALLRAAPYYAAYLIVLPLGVPAAANELGRPVVIHAAEAMAAFTLLGYLVAESRGRRELRYGGSVGAVLLAAAVSVAFGQTVAAGGWPSLTGWPRLAAALVAAGYGGWVYHLQRDAIRGQVAQVARPEPVPVDRSVAERTAA